MFYKVPEDFVEHISFETYIKNQLQYWWNGDDSLIDDKIGRPIYENIVEKIDPIIEKCIETHAPEIDRVVSRTQIEEYIAEKDPNFEGVVRSATMRRRTSPEERERATNIMKAIRIYITNFMRERKDFAVEGNRTGAYGRVYRRTGTPAR